MSDNTFDLAEFAEKTLETSDLEIEHPVTGQPTGIKITLLSADSDAWKKQVMRMRKENVKYRDRRDGIPPEKVAEDAVNLLVACSVGWQGVKENGSDLPFSKENAKRIYEQFPFIREQVDAFISDRRNFIMD